MKFDPDNFVDALPRIGEALFINAWMTAVVCLLALATGIALTILRSFKIASLNAVFSVFISFIRGTPILVQIFLCYYALPALGLNLNATSAGILALTLNSAVFISEIFRGGLRSINEGQIEAATALGLRPAHIWWRVVLPQLLRISMPLLVSESSIVLKATALLSVITVVEGLRVAQQIGAANFSPLEPFVAVAIGFVVLYLILTGIGQIAERRLAFKVR